MKNAILFASAFALLAAVPARAQLQIPPETAGNTDECYNSDGDSAECHGDLHRSGAWITGDSDNVKDVVLTDGQGGEVIIPNGSYREHVVDYRVLFNQGDSPCGDEPIVQTPHHAPYVLEFSRWFRTRASYTDYGLTKGWKDNLIYLLSITNGGGFRSARFEVPSGVEMNWVDAGNTGTWTEDMAGLQSMVLTLTDEAGDQHLVTDRWGGRYHFVPNTGARPNLQYLMDWMEDENGNRISVTYTAEGYPTQAADGFGRVVRYTWGVNLFNGTRHILAVQLPDGNTLQFQYFFSGQKTYKLTYPNGDVASYGKDVDADGDFYYFNDPRGEPGARKARVYTYAFGPAFEFDTGRVRGLKDESGHVQLIRLEDPLDARITIEYDDGRAFLYECQHDGLDGKITNLRTGAVTTKDWQANGGLLKVDTDAYGHSTIYDYDDARALQTLRHNLNGTTETWSYNALNRVQDHVDPNGNLTHFDYDVRGNLIKETYADGSFDQWTRQPSGRVTAYTDRDGHTTSYQYDARGNVSQITRPAEPSESSPVTSFTYDVNGRVLSNTDPLGNVTTYAYDALGRRVLTTQPDTTTEQLTYGSMDLLSPTDPVATAGLVVESKDRNGNLTDYEFGANDRLVHVTGAPGDVVYTYDAQDRFVSRTENGDSVSYGYDAAYRRTSVTRVPDSLHVLTTTFAYDLLDRVVTETDPYGFATNTSYTNASEVSLVTHQIDGPLVSATNFTYDGNGNVLTRADNGDVRSFVYDSNDRLLRAYDPAPFDANFVAYSYDFEGHRLAKTDQLGNTWSSAYGNRGNLSSETDPTGLTLVHKYYLDDLCRETDNLGTTGKTFFTYACCNHLASSTVLVDGGAKDIPFAATYDGNGNVLTRADGEANVWTHGYDARNREVLASDPLGAQTVTTYSDDGSPFDGRLAAGQGSAVSVTDANGNTTTNVYDGVGRLLREIDGLGASTVHAYDIPSGATIGTTRTDRNGHTTAEYRDGLERVVRTVDGLNQSRFQFYDQDGNLVRVQDARGNSTVFTYDALDRRVREDYPGVDDFVTYTYYANGLLASKTDQEGNLTQYVYDAAGRLLTKQYQDASTDVFTYDAGGRLATADSGIYLNSVARFYDRADRVVRELSSREVRMAYDRRSLETSVITPSGFQFDFSYTARGELDTIESGSTTYADQTFDPAGNLVRRDLGNGASSNWSYDADNRVTHIDHVRGADELLRLKYKYDGEGHTLEQRNLTFVSRNEFYEYDAADRLVLYRGKAPPVRKASPVPFDPLKGASKSQTWVLDPEGNWNQTVRNLGTPEVRLHDSVNALTVIVGSAFLDYDKNGNLIDDGTFTYSYDFNNRLREIHEKADDSPVAQYTYDALGRRVARTALDKSVIAQRRFVYFYDGDRIVELREKPSLNDPDQFFAAFAYGRPDEPVVMVRTGNTFYYHQNARASSVVLTRQTGDIVERYEYDPFGTTQVLAGTWMPIGDTSGVTNIFTFLGHEADSEAGLVYFRSRSLGPLIGRYLQRNPAGYASGMNLYAATELPLRTSPFGTDD